MRRAAARVAAGVALWCAASCLNITDVVQPAEVDAGKKFEVRVILDSDISDAGAAEHSFAGVLAVSIPVGAEIIKASYDGAADGRFDKYTTLAPNDLPERPGYFWVFLVTSEKYIAEEYGGKTYTAILKIRAPQTPGEYRLAYAAATIDMEGADTRDRGVCWGSVPGNGRPDLERGITVK
jgi:hypothetical protein